MKSESKTAGGIFLPESSVKELNEGKVLAVGPGGMDKDGKRIAMSVAEGDRVLIPQVCALGVCINVVEDELMMNSTEGAPSRLVMTIITSSAIPKSWQRSTSNCPILGSSTLTGQPSSNNVPSRYHSSTSAATRTTRKEPHTHRPKTPRAFSETRRSSQCCIYHYFMPDVLKS